MVTIKRIAELANVSRGTVDKVLNNRPGVKKETRERVEQIIKALDYRPNPLGKALATCKTPLKMGIALLPGYNQFMQLMVQGIKSQEEELKHYGIDICLRLCTHVDPVEQLSILQEFRDNGIKNIALFPLQNEPIIQFANQLVENGTTLITFNSRVERINSLFFIGQNSYMSGRTVAELIEKLIPEGKVGLIISSMLMTCHQDRVAGFYDRLNQSGRYEVLSYEDNNDMDTLAFEMTLDLISQAPDLRAIYITGGGVSGVAEALKLKHLERIVKVICHDLTPDSERLLREDLVDFVIDQEPVKQGRLLVSSLYEQHIYGQILNRESADIPIIIRTKETLK